MKKWLTRTAVVLLFLGILIAAYLYYRLHDRHPGFRVNLTVANKQEGRLSAGFSAMVITPEVPDTWTDANGDAIFDEASGDKYQDGNGNGQFDPVWIAGYHNNRPAKGIHDDLWVRTMVIDDGNTRIAIAALDLIGFGADDILEVRKRIPAEWKITYPIITSTHTHEGPDVVGMWGKSPYASGVDKKYLAYVKERILASLGEAVGRLRPATVSFAQDSSGARDLVYDYRQPIAFDYGLRLMHLRDAETDTTLGTLIQWANHPETLEDRNLLISSDFPHFLRESFEKGVYAGDSLIHPGRGGTAVYVNGAIGGMMSTGSERSISSLNNLQQYKEASFDKASAQGQRLALLALRALDSQRAAPLLSAAIQLRAMTLHLPLDNKLYRLGATLGIFNRGLSGWWKIRTELAIWRLGPATFLHQPGELYPEIANGVVEAPAGQDYAVPPTPDKPLRALMPGEFRFLIGLSNDFIGYILPISQWDEKAPYTYGQKEAPYGEINSVGPRTAPIVYDSLTSLIRQIQY